MTADQLREQHVKTCPACNSDTVNLDIPCEFVAEYAYLITIESIQKNKEQKND